MQKLAFTLLCLLSTLYVVADMPGAKARSESHITLNLPENTKGWNYYYYSDMGDTSTVTPIQTQHTVITLPGGRGRPAGIYIFAKNSDGVKSARMHFSNAMGNVTVNVDSTTIKEIYHKEKRHGSIGVVDEQEQGPNTNSIAIILSMLTVLGLLFFFIRMRNKAVVGV